MDGGGDVENIGHPVPACLSVAAAQSFRTMMHIRPINGTGGEDPGPKMSTPPSCQTLPSAPRCDHTRVALETPVAGRP
jgi:hypothetical protein